MVILYGVSGVVCLLGLLLLIRALRGRRVSSNPHCAHCGFDLLGLTLDRDAQCPECGRPTIPGTPAVRDGLFKRRPVLGLFALLLIGGGVTGFAWPKVSQMPSIRNFDWYALFPESLLLKLEAGGNKDALQALHDRLIPGTLSDEGLQTLIQQSLAMLDDETEAWDERWGDVLLYGVVTGKIKPADQAQYLESRVIPNLYLHDSVSTTDPYIESQLVFYSSQRGHAKYQFVEQARMSGSPLFDKVQQLKSEFEHEIHATSDGVPLNSMEMTSKQSGDWFPSQSAQTTARARVIPQDQTENIDFEYLSTLRVLLDGQVLHEWAINAKGSTTRVEGAVEYAKALQSSVDAERLASSLVIGSIQIPSNVEEALEHEELHTYRISLGGIQGSAPTQVGLAGRLCFVDGDREIPYIDMIATPIGDADIQGVSVSNELGWTYRISSSHTIEYGLEEFVRDQVFWEQARKRGRVDVVLHPDPSLLISSPRIQVYLDEPVLFRDVSLEYLVPNQSPGSERWGWEYRGTGTRQEQLGELYKD